ncbi:MAG: Ca2+-dependent phosphoinositide-specific phospholipase C [Phycisphaerales bacterium]
MRHLTHCVTFALLLLWLILPACAGTNPREADRRDLRLNQVQVIGSHNSFKSAIQPELAAQLRKFSRAVDDADYAHLSLTDQLNLGLRNLELDVYADPEGGRYANPLGNQLLAQAGVEPWPLDPEGQLLTPGFKMIHQADFDFRSTVIAFEAGLSQLASWSIAHPGHGVVVVTMNCKQAKFTAPGSVEPARFDRETLSALDEVIARTLGRERLLTPDDVRGGSATLREGLRARGWPTEREAAGRFLFVLDEGGATRDLYLKAFPGLRGAVFFPDTAPDAPEAGVFVVNDPIADADRIRDLVARGYLVRTRADADTREARRNDRARFEAAKASGAQIITTDYYIPDRKVSDRYFVRFEDGGFARPNPVAAPTRAR